jgi:hypothetical protein
LWHRARGREVIRQFDAESLGVLHRRLRRFQELYQHRQAGDLMHWPWLHTGKATPTA